MNYNLAFIAIVEILSAISIGIFILVLTYKIMEYVGKKYYDIHEYNLAYSIFNAAVILSVGIILSGIIEPLISSFRIFLNSDGGMWISLKYVGIGGIYIAIAYTATVLIGLISTYLYSKITPINEFKEIRNNNIGVAIIVSSILITLIIMSKDGIILLVESIVPYPDLPRF